MKKISYKTKLVSLAMAVVFSTAFTINASANSTEPTDPLSLSFVGTESNSPAFKLSVFNPDENQFSVEVYDQNNLVLYTETVDGTSISKKFLLNINDLKDAILTFKVTGKKTGEYSVYQIDCNTLASKNWTAKKVH